MEIQQDPHAFGCEAAKPPAGAESESVQLNESSLLKGYILVDGEGLYQGLIIFLFSLQVTVWHQRGHSWISTSYIFTQLLFCSYLLFYG